MVKRNKTDIIQFKIRMREDLRKRLEEVATAERRSLNSEIVARLEQSFARGPNQLAENTVQYSLNAKHSLELAEAISDPEQKRMIIGLARAWLALATHHKQNVEAAASTAFVSGPFGSGFQTAANEEPELPMPQHQFARPRRP
jgi:hypothetical protein